MPLLRVLSLLDAQAVTGPAKNLMQLCRGLNAGDDARITIATIARLAPDKTIPASPFTEAARASGIEVDVLGERYRYDPGLAEQLRAIAERRRPDVIETHGVRMHFLARSSGLAAKIPWVAFHHGYTAEDLKMRAYNQIDRWSLRRASRIFTDCEPFSDQLAGFGIAREKLRALASSIELREPATPQEIAALRRRLEIAPDESVILSIGRLSREKAQADLLTAVGLLPKRKFRLILAGDGPERNRLQDAAVAAGLARAVIFAGHQHDVRPFYGLADVFVLSSLSEGSPNVLLEAMAAGTPIVSTSVGGVPEMIENGWSGLLVPRANPAALASAIERMLADPAMAEACTRNAAAVVRERFSPEAYRKIVVEAYRAVQSR
ncbi:MAG TPA: glycosyltransferase family 4 protein [Bryobacteraceae bacterium]|nr:glycosyltransferase family 4 protein [Bryobacteraceae bacterium]